MNIRSTEIVFEVEYGPRTVTARDAYQYEVSTTIVEVLIGGEEDGTDWYNARTKGHKLTAAGQRSKSAPHALPIYGDEVAEIEEEAIEVVRQHRFKERDAIKAEAIATTMKSMEAFA